MVVPGHENHHAAEQHPQHQHSFFLRQRGAGGEHRDHSAPTERPLSVRRPSFGSNLGTGRARAKSHPDHELAILQPAAPGSSSAAAAAAAAVAVAAGGALLLLCRRRAVSRPSLPEREVEVVVMRPRCRVLRLRMPQGAGGGLT